MDKKPPNRGGRKAKQPVGRQMDTVPSRQQNLPAYDANGQRIDQGQKNPATDSDSAGQKRKLGEESDIELPIPKLRISSEPPKRGLPIKSADGVKAHDKEPHIPCRYDCGKLFRFPSKRDEHEQEHSNKQFECPGKDEFGCEMQFNTSSLARTHYNKFRRPPKSYICEWNPRSCDASFDTKTEQIQHRNEVHNGKLPCPEAERFNCDKGFSTGGTANTHLATHFDNQCRCDYPGCDVVVSDKYKLEDHRKKKHDKTWEMFACPKAEELNCEEVFTTYVFAIHHADQKHTGFWYCTVPMCERAVCEWPMGKRDWERHEEKHEKQGDFIAFAERPKPRHVPGGAPENDEVKNMEEVEISEDQSSKSLGDNHEENSRTETQDVEVIDFEPFDASLEEHQLKIKALNQECIEKHPDLTVSDSRAGLRCLGPRHYDDRGFVTILCPFNTKISTETTFYKAWTGKNSPGIRLRSRCASCSAQLRIAEILKSDLWAQPDQKHCCYKSCKNPMDGSLKFCKEHLNESKNRVKDAYGPSYSDMEIFRQLRALLQSSFAKVWKYDDEGDPVGRMFAAIDNIRSGRTSGSDVICLDL